MSDQSVADQGDPGADEATKATPDQPGQPNVSQGSPRMVGSPMQLGELVTRAMAMGQGRPQGPLPQPQPVAPFDQLQQRFMQREAPYARPTGPFPPFIPGQVQTYVPARPIRSPSEWGTDEPYANQPNTWEVPGMWAGIGQKLSQIGSGNVQKLTPFLGGGTDMKAYLAGQSAALRVQQERRRNAAEQLAEIQGEELNNARDVVALYHGDPSTGIGVDTNMTLPRLGKYKDAMLNVARQGNDNILEVAVQQEDWKAVDNILKERDATHRDLKAANAAAAQAEEEGPYRGQPTPTTSPTPGSGQPATQGDVDGPNGLTLGEAPPSPATPDYARTPPTDGTEGAAAGGAEGAAADGAGATPDSAAGGGDAPGADIDRAEKLLSPDGGRTTGAPATGPRAAPPAPGAPVAGAAAPQAQADVPSPQAQPAQAAAPSPGGDFQLPPGGEAGRQVTVQPRAPAWQPTPSMALHNAKAQGFLNYRAIDDDAQEMVAGRKKPADYKGNAAVGALVSARAREISDDLKRIRDSNLQGDAVLNAVHRVAPNIADDLKPIVDGAIPLPSASGMGGVRAYPLLLAQFAHKARPLWAAHNYTDMAQFSNPNGQTQRTLKRVRTLMTAAQNLATNINKLPDEPNAFKAQLDYFLKNGVAQDNRYQRVFADWQAVAIESNVLRTGGTGSVTETEQIIKSIKMYGSKEQYRAALQEDLDVAESNLISNRELWGRYNAGNPNAPTMPGDTPGADQVFGAFKRMNSKNGYIPGDVPASMQGVIPRSVSQAADFVRANITSPDPNLRAKALQIQQWLIGEGQ